MHVVGPDMLHSDVGGGAVSLTWESSLIGMRVIPRCRCEQLEWCCSSYKGSHLGWPLGSHVLRLGVFQ